jgi:hypothetical protein
MSVLLSTEQTRRRPMEGNRRSIVRRVIVTERRPTSFLRKVSSEAWKTNHDAKIKAFFVSCAQYMSLDNSCTTISKRQTSYFEHRSLEDALFSPVTLL